ncbi:PHOSPHATIDYLCHOLINE TRANSFER PROTEIN [Salix koriyanagi]|uniref:PHOSPHATIDYLCHOLINE TRANSFER PROTEIN n=1 Tax=Salix koriyanagi TaxID=2511006 RepID=A0A9Q0PFR0_9ROSI|nr:PHOSPHATIDYLCHOLINE TRANSFER PROTEIN [Salix koriyanagi]
MALIEALYEVLGNPSSMLGVCTEMVGLLAPLWIAFLIGLVLGWSWKPKWVTRKSDKLSCCVSKILDSSLPSSPCRSLMSPLKTFGSFSQWNSFMLRSSTCEASWAVDNNNNNNNLAHQNLSPVPPTEYEDCRSLLNEEQSNVASQVTEEDLEHLYQLVEVKDGGPTWMHMMDRSTSTMSYKAWRRDPKTGPPQYRSSTVFEDASPEIVRDFFWDDDFRPKWDDMLLYSSILDECRTTGTMLVHWVRKFPFFCSDREYIIGRRIWESGRSYYCVTKGVPSSSIPRRDKPRRVDLYYSSWCIRAVESRKGDGQLTACEVLLFHYEDMGIPWEIAKLGVRQGMWGTVKKIEPGLRAYQRTRASGRTLSQPALMARINTKINPELLRSLGDDEDLSEIEAATTPEKSLGRNIPKLLIVGGAIALACGFDRGLLTKAFIFSVGRRFGNMGKNAKLSAGST